MFKGMLELNYVFSYQQEGFPQLQSSKEVLEKQQQKNNIEYQFRQVEEEKQVQQKKIEESEQYQKLLESAKDSFKGINFDIRASNIKRFREMVLKSQ